MKTNKLPELCFEMAGRFKLEKFKVDENGNEIQGSRTVAADWFNNLITNNGLNMVGNVSGDFMLYCQVGSGSATPTVTDTGLQSRIGASSTEQARVVGTNNTVSPYYGYRRKTYRFAAGTATGNVSELGISPASTGAVFSRALVLDGGGSPTTITILSDEVLDVIYELRLYVPMNDATGSITLSSEGSTHTWTFRALEVDGSGNTPWSSFRRAFDFAIVNQNWQQNGIESGLQAITANGYAATGTNATGTLVGSYVVGNYYRDVQIFFDLNQANFATGIGRVAICTNYGAYQYGFSPKIAKINTKKLTLVVRISWARKVL